MNATTRSLLPRAAGATAVAMVFAIAIGSADSPLRTHGESATAAVAAAIEHPAIPALHNDHHANDRNALTAMHGYAAVHLDHFEVLADTFGGTSHWWPDWDLHWIDVRHGDRLVRIYHATHKHQPHVGYTVMCDHETGHTTDWEHAH